MKLAGRKAVITGGASGIGQAVAIALAKEGADVAIADLASADETVALVEAQGVKCVSALCDVSDEHAVGRFTQLVEQELGGVDILFNNAGIFRKIDFADLGFEVWKHYFDVNVHSCFLMTQAMLSMLKRSGCGRVINLSSSTVWLNVPSYVHYITTKAAVIGLTNALATELGPFDITVNAIAPGMVRTPGTIASSDGEDEFTFVTGMQSLKRQAVPSDISGLAAFLATSDAGMITGQTLSVDGGLTR